MEFKLSELLTNKSKIQDIESKDTIIFDVKDFVSGESAEFWESLIDHSKLVNCELMCFKHNPHVEINGLKITETQFYDTLVFNPLR